VSILLQLKLATFAAKMQLQAEKDGHTHFEHAVDARNDSSPPLETLPSLNITSSSMWDNKKGIFICLLINMALFEYGLDQGMVNGFQAMPGFLLDFGYANPNLPGGLGISATVQQLIGSLVSLGMFITTFASGYVSNTIGRKGTLWFGCALMVLSVVVQMSAINFPGLYSGRLILGFANGFLLVAAQLYMQESMPANLRSLGFTFWQFWISFGALIGAIVNNATSTILTRASYRIPLGVLFVIPAVLSVTLLFLPDTPRYYALKGRLAEAEKSLRFLRDASFTDLQVKEELAEIVHALEVERETNAHAGYLKIFRTKTDTKRTLTSVGLALYAAASGVPFITQYGVYFFLLAGDTKPFRDGVILLCCGLAGVMTTPFFTGKVGKRPLLMIGGVLQSFCMLGVGVSYSVRGIDKTSGNVIIAMASIYLFFASATTSPFAWQVCGEVPSQQLRSHTMGFASAISFLFGWSITFTIPYFINPTALNWGPNYAYIWCATNLLIVIFTFFVVPETNKRTLEEIDECYLQQVAIRKFPQYECVGTKRARLAALQKSSHVEVEGPTH